MKKVDGRIEEIVAREIEEAAFRAPRPEEIERATANRPERAHDGGGPRVSPLRGVFRGAFLGGRFAVSCAAAALVVSVFVAALMPQPLAEHISAFWPVDADLRLEAFVSDACLSLVTAPTSRPQ